MYETLCTTCRGARPGCDDCNGRGRREVWRCPVSQAGVDAFGALESRRHYMHGFLPAEGSLSDQPAPFLDALTVIEVELADIASETAAEGSS